MKPSDTLIAELKKAVSAASRKPGFVHHSWFVEYHLEIVAQIAKELVAFYPKANPQVVEAMAWIHDYGKTISFENQYQLTQSEGRKLMQKIGFSPEFTETVIGYVDTLDKKLEVDIRQAPIEVQIVSSADGCSHLVGPFMKLWWLENPNKPFKKLMQDNYEKAKKDWDKKIVLPEARAAFETRYKLMLEQSGKFAKSFLD